MSKKIIKSILIIITIMLSMLILQAKSVQAYNIKEAVNNGKRIFKVSFNNLSDDNLGDGVAGNYTFCCSQGWKLGQNMAYRLHYWIKIRGNDCSVTGYFATTGKSYDMAGVGRKK